MANIEKSVAICKFFECTQEELKEMNEDDINYLYSFIPQDV